MNRIFILSPAYCGGKRSQLLFRAEANFDLAQRLRNEGGVKLGELFSFLSGLYFRGKLAYSQAFAQPPAGVPGTVIITPTRGLMMPAESVDLNRLQEFAAVEIGLSEERFREPLIQTARLLAEQLSSECEVVLLGSIATGKYLDLLEAIFSERLRFPVEFAGRGDMSRGGLLLRCVTERCELEYVSLSQGARHASRPPKLSRIRRTEIL